MARKTIFMVGDTVEIKSNGVVGEIGLIEPNQKELNIRVDTENQHFWVSPEDLEYLHLD